MSYVKPHDLANSILGAIYDVLTNGDETVPPSEDNFLTWCTPGIPINASELDFVERGVTGAVRREAISEMVVPTTPDAAATSGAGQIMTTTKPELTPALLDSLRASDTGRLYQQAESFSRLFDFIPDVSLMNNDQFAKWSVANNEGSISDCYGYVLQMSQVASLGLDQKTQEKIDKFRNMLVKKTIKKDLIDDSDIETVEPSPLSKAYFAKMAAFNDAALEYTAAHVAALAADNPQAVHYWAQGAKILRNKVQAALDDWITSGYKVDYERIAAFIDQVMQRDMSLLKKHYQQELENARQTGIASGSDFYWASMVPGNPAKSSGWTKFTFSQGDHERHSKSTYTHKDWSTKAGGSFLGIFGGGGGASHCENRRAFDGSFRLDDFFLKFQMCQVPIVRAWFKPSFFLSKLWRMDPKNPEARQQMISDGGKPPKGLLPAYPTSVIFVRDLSMKLGHSEGFNNFVREEEKTSASGGGALSIGPLFLGGSCRSASGKVGTQNDWGYKWDGQTITVEGMQIAGFRCHVLPKCPDPLPSIQEWD